MLWITLSITMTSHFKRPARSADSVEVEEQVPGDRLLGFVKFWAIRKE